MLSVNDKKYFNEFRDDEEILRKAKNNLRVAFVEGNEVEQASDGVFMVDDTTGEIFIKKNNSKYQLSSDNNQIKFIKKEN